MTSSLWALQPIANDYSDEQNVFAEFRNIYDSQGIFTQVNSTPNVTDMKDGEMVVYNSSPSFVINDSHLILRVGTTLYYSPNFKLITGR